MAFVKLDADILESTLWALPVERDLFITALLMARPKTLTEPMPQLNVATGQETGFVVPPGEYGFIDTAGVGILRRAFPNDDSAPKRRKVSKEEGLQALHALGEPEADSRTPDHEGRRLVRVAGGFVALNFELYRNKDHTGADRQRRFRARHGSNGVTSLRVTQAEAYAEEEIRKEALRAFPADADEKGWKKLATEYGVKLIPGEEWNALKSRIRRAVHGRGRVKA